MIHLCCVDLTQLKFLLSRAKRCKQQASEQVSPRFDYLIGEKKRKT